MDHLPPVSQPHDPISVPFLGGTYAGHNFTEFQLPEPLSLELLRQDTVPLQVAEWAAPVLQVWFFFGLLHEVLGLPIDQDDFVETTAEHGAVVTTAKLKAYLAKWKVENDQAKRDATGTQLTDRNARVIHCLQTSHMVWRSIPQFATIVGEEVQLSIHILASTLENAVNCISEISVYDLPWRQERSTFLVRRMLKDQWCPVLIEQVAKRSSVPWHYYASLCPPSVTHGPEFACDVNDMICKLRLARTTLEDYAPKHVCESGDCPTMRASPPGMVEALIADGHMPLLEYDDSNPELRVVKYEQGQQYTAISHVWTDGMGNAEDNRLPKCQLQRLQQAMSKLPWTNKCRVSTEEEADRTWPGNVKAIELTPDPEAARLRPLLFWIDTICVPLTGPLRQRAINSMRRVYNRANRVLVFDIDLVRVRGAVSPEEVLTRVSLSNWLRRFWTLQEGVLAKLLWYQFGDDSYRQLSISSVLDQADISSDEQAAKRVKEFYYDNEVGWYADDFDLSWRALAHRWTYSQRLAIVWGQLEHRTSRYASDRPICIATLMDMDINAIQEVPADDRIRAIWRMYAAVPTGVLFVVAPRFAHAPYRWAPVSLARLSPLPPPGMSSEAIRTDRGLRVEHHGILTTSRLERNRHGVIAMQVDQRVYLIKQNLKQRNTPWAGVDFTQFERLAVLISSDKVDKGSTFPPFERALGALVGIPHAGPETGAQTADSPEVIECEYLRAVSVLLQKSRWEFQGQAWSAVDEQEKSWVVPATYSPVQQNWLIT